jgi:bacteriocin biosynthesis docking scaffold, SagD family
MDVTLRGNGPAANAVAAALADCDSVAVTDAAFTTVDLAVVVGAVSDERFGRANDQALAAGTDWIAVELGGIGGVSAVEAAVVGLGATVCYECLTSRVEAATDDRTEHASAVESAAELPVRTKRFAGAVAGRMAAAAASAGAGDDHAVPGQVVTVPYTERELLAVPGCSCAPTVDRRSMTVGGVDRDREASLDRAERAVDDVVGIVAEVGEAESFPAPYYLTQAGDTTGFSDTTAAQQAAGVSAEWNGALMKALGEALERYAAGVYRSGGFETARPGDLQPAVAPDAFVTPADATGSSEQALAWVRGRNLHTGADTWLPAELVQYPPPSSQLRPPITTGLGLGNGTVEALLSGLYEVLERDAAILSWYSTFDPLGLTVDDELFGRLAARARSEGLSVTPVLLTQDVDVPVVAVAVQREEWPRFALGTDADLDTASAARSALAEALQNWMELRGMGPDGAAAASGAIGRYARAPDAAGAFVSPETTVPAASVGPNDPPAGEAELRQVLEHAAQAGLTAYAASVTTRDLAALGFEASRVLLPTAQPLFFGNSYFGGRAHTVPQALGFEPRVDRDHHPFP